MRQTIHLMISGHVQGVGYPAWVAHEAPQRGLDGWVRNRSDGTVEAVFSGPTEAVHNMRRACRIGPQQANVTGIAETPEDNPPASGFRVLATQEVTHGPA